MRQKTGGQEGLQEIRTVYMGWELSHIHSGTGFRREARVPPFDGLRSVSSVDHMLHGNYGIVESTQKPRRQRFGVQVRIRSGLNGATDDREQRARSERVSGEFVPIETRKCLASR